MEENKFDELLKNIMTKFYLMDRCNETLKNIGLIVKLNEEKENF